MALSPDILAKTLKSLDADLKLLTDYERSIDEKSNAEVRSQFEAIETIKRELNTCGSNPDKCSAALNKAFAHVTSKHNNPLFQKIAASNARKTPPPKPPPFAAAAPTGAAVARAGGSGLPATSGSTEISAENIEKVKKRLSELAKTHGNEDLKNVIDVIDANYTDYLHGSSEDKSKAADLLRNIIKFPGWGVVENPQDKYTRLTEEDVKNRIGEAWRIYRSENLEGTEDIVRPIFEQYEMMLSHRVNQTGELDPSKVGKMPYICIDGPPGTGKTTIAKAIAKAFGMGFYDVSISGQNDENFVYGRGKEWKAAGPGIVAKAMLKTGRERTLILLDEAEKCGKGLEESLLQILEIDQHGYREKFFDDATIDKRKAMFVLTTNNYDRLSTPIQSRLVRLYVEGYSDEKKTTILRHMAVSLIKNLKIKFKSNDDRNRSQFSPIEDPELDVIKYIAVNYLTEPGVRQAKALLSDIIARANSQSVSTGKETIVDKDFVIKILGKPNPSLIKIKGLENEIANNKKVLSESSVSVRQQLFSLESLDQKMKAEPREIEKLSTEIRKMLQYRAKFFEVETRILRAFRQVPRGPVSNYLKGRQEEHTQDIADVMSWSTAILENAAEYYQTLNQPVPKFIEDALKNPTQPPPPSPMVDLSDRKRVGDRDPRHMGSRTATGSRSPSLSDASTSLSSRQGSTRRGPVITMKMTDDDMDETPDLSGRRSASGKSAGSDASLTLPSFQAAALRSAKLGAKMKTKGAYSPITDEGWVKLHHEIRDKFVEENEKATGEKPIKNRDKYSDKEIELHNQARAALYQDWSVEPVENPNATSFDLVKKENGKPKTMGTVSRDVIGNKIEFVAAQAKPGDDAIFHSLEVFYTNARQTGKKGITISECTDAISAIKLKEYGTLMGLEVAFDESSQKLIDSHTAQFPTDVQHLKDQIKAQADLIHLEPTKPKGPRIQSG